MHEVTTAFWSPQGAWAAHAVPGQYGRQGERPGIQIETLERTLRTLVVGGGDRDALRVRINRFFALDLPDTRRAVFGAETKLVWSAPDQWLVVSTTRQALLGLADELAGIAAVTDQTDSRGLVKITGPRVRDALAKGFAIDLHPAAFPSGFVAVTKVAHLSVQIWREDDAFIIAVPRSFAGSFWAWLMAASAEFGCQVATSVSP